MHQGRIGALAQWSREDRRPTRFNIDVPEMYGADLGALPSRDPNDNPYYLLLTLYGELSHPIDESVAERNRAAWNNWMLQGHPLQAPPGKNWPERASEAMLREIEAAFAARSQGRAVALPKPGTPFKAEGTIFSRSLVLSGCWVHGLKLTSCVFNESVMAKDGVQLEKTLLVRCTFNHLVSFARMIFLRAVEIEACNFTKQTSFNEAIFHAEMRATDSLFSEPEWLGQILDFSSAEFRGPAYFWGVTATLMLTCIGTRFHFGLSCSDCRLLSANLSGARFDDSTQFARTIFRHGANFTAAVFKDEASFKSSYFEFFPPTFWDATLTEGTLWPERSAWPTPHRLEAAGAVSRYASLKRHMEVQKRQNDELDFFCLELHARRFTKSWYDPPGLMIAAYFLISDFGRSVRRPLIIFLFFAILGIYVIAADPAYTSEWSPGRVWGMSLANMLGPLGFRKELIGESVYHLLSPFTLFFAGVQTVVGLGLLFLIGLALRNMFRLKG